MDKNKLEKQAIGILAQLFDLAEVPIEKRQQINDTAYDYMLEQLRLHSVVGQSEQLPCEHPFASVMSKCNGEINKCLKCGEEL